MEDFTDLNTDDVEEPNSFISLETNVDLLLEDVTLVQKILDSNNVGQYVDVNEIYEKLEELTYIIREERIEYVATQLLYKFGVITDIHAEHAFNTEYRESENSENLKSSYESPNANDPLTVETCVSSNNTERFKNNSYSHDIRAEVFDDISTKKPHSIVHECNLEKNSAQHNDKDVGAVGGSDETFSYFEIGCQSENSSETEACASVNQDKSKVKPSTFAVDHVNTGLSNYIGVGVAENNDNHSNGMELFGEEIMEEAKFILGMFPHFELEQILEFLNVNRDVENRIEVVSDEILRFQESMLQENTKMSELIEMGNKGKYNDYSEKMENPKVSHKELVDLTSDSFVTQVPVDTNLVCIATDDIHVESKNEIQLGNCEHISVSDVENNLLAYNDTEALFIQGNSTTNEQRHVNCDITSNADRASPLLSDLTTSVLESVALTEVTSPTLNLVLSPICDLENSVFSSNSQLNNALQQKVTLTSHIPPDLVPSASKSATPLHEETQLNILDRIEQSILDTPNFLLEKTPSISQVNILDRMKGPTADIMNVSTNLMSSVSKLASLQNENLPSQINSAIPEIERLTSNIADVSSELMSLVSELTGRQCKERESTSQLNCTAPEIKRSTSNVITVSSELLPSVSELASSQSKEIESTSQLNCAVTEIERSISNVGNVSSELVPSVFELISSQTKETESTSQLNCAVPEIERSTSNVGNVSSELVPSVFELASPQTKETESTSQLNCAVTEIERSTSNVGNVSSELVPSVFELASPQTKETESTSQLNCAVPEIERSTSNVGNVSSELVSSVFELASPQTKETESTSQLNCAVTEIERSTSNVANVSSELVPSVFELASPQTKETESTSQLNCAVPEIERSTSNEANVSSELVLSVSELASSQPKETESISQLNCAVPEIERSTSNVANVSSELVPSVFELASPQTKETESTSQLNCAVPEIERSTSNEANVSSELVPSVSELASSQPKETESISQLNCAVPEIERSTSNVANVSSELVPSVSELASSQPKETESISQLNCAVPEIERSTSNEANVSSELVTVLPKLAIPQAIEASPTSQLSEVMRPNYDLEIVSCGLRSSTFELASSSQEVTKLNNVQNELSDASTLEKLNSPSEVPLSLSPTTESLYNPLTEATPSTTQLQNQGCRKKEITYEEFVSSLPHVDVVLLKEVWAQIGNNYSAVKEFITQQLEAVPDDNHYHLLLSMFPQADPKYLQETSLIIGMDEVALKDFIDEQLQKDESKARYHMLLAMFPKVESTYLHKKCIEVGNDDEAMRNLIVELLNISESDNNYHTLLTMFPESDPAFLREKADRIGNDDEAMKKFVTEYLEEMETVPFKSLVAVLPDADPEYLQNIYEKLGNNEESLKLFIMEALETKNYPTRESYLKRQEIATLERKYKEELNIQEFFDMIPDPWTYFRNKKSNENERRHALSYLESHFKTIALEQINSCFQNNNYNLTLACDQLNKWTGPFQQIREMFQHVITDTEDIPVPFLQEVAFIENKTEMEEFLERREQERKEAFELAKANGELLECQCCFDNELMIVDVSTCTEGHIFCKECIKRSAEVTIGNGNTHFLCLTNCLAEFSLRIIQTVLNPTTFSRMLQRRQLEEVQAAGIQDLENCPFCEFASIPATNSQVFTCFNPDCMRDSCRKCKRASHIPLRCDEVESKEINVRTMIEDRMTEALVRTCWKCKKKFIKESGCNKMTCGCGAMMCYLCRQPVQNYNHFNGQGGTEFDKCPLYSELEVIHDVAVQEEGIKAKKEVQEQNPDVILRHDPTEMKPF